MDGTRVPGVTQGIPELLRSAANEGVLASLADLSAHDDVAGALVRALSPLGDVETFTPDVAKYRYVVASSRGVIFAFAVGMAEIGFRLAPDFKARALASGARECPQAGPGWVTLTLFRVDWPEPHLQFWARAAYAHARG